MDGFDAEAEQADALASLRLGLHERALDGVVRLVLRGVPVSPPLMALVDSFLPADRRALWVDAVSFASLGMRATGLACVAGALLAGSPDVERGAGLSWALRKLGVDAPATDDLPLIDAELVS